MNARRALAAVALGMTALVGVGGSAAAATTTSAPALFDICKKEPPRAEIPGEGNVGSLDERPANPAPLTEETIWSNGGLVGMHSVTFDLGCSPTPSTAVFLATASMNVKTTNLWVDAGSALSGFAYAIESKAWNPAWVGDVFADFMGQSIETVRRQVWVPWTFLGLIACSAFLVVRARRQDVSGVTTSVGWALLVLGISGAFILSPIFAPVATQKAGSTVALALNGDSASGSVAQSNADRVAYSVNYQDFLRRSFGTSNSDIAKKYGLRLLAASRLSWAEKDQVAGDPAKLEAMQKRKGEDWVKVAAEVDTANKNAYYALQGHPGAHVGGMLGFAFSAAVNVFRLLAAAVMVAAVIFLAFISLIWLVGAAYFVTPIGASKGREIMQMAGMAFGYTLACAIGSWLFMLWARVSLAPGVPVAWSLVMLIVGSILFWSMLRPDRKMLAMFTGGKFGTGGHRLVGRALRAGIAGATAGYVAGKTADDDDDEPGGGGGFRDDDPPPAPPVPALPAPARMREIGPGRVYEGRVVDAQDTVPSTADAARAPRALPAPPRTIAGEVIYQRGADE